MGSEMCIRDSWTHVREERHLVALSAQRPKGPAHATHLEQHKGDDELGDAERGSGLAGRAPGRDAGRVGRSRAFGADEEKRNDGVSVLRLLREVCLVGDIVAPRT